MENKSKDKQIEILTKDMRIMWLIIYFLSSLCGTLIGGVLF